MRAVLDPNVIVSALLAPSGTPAKVLRAWLDGDYELIASPLLLEELTRVFNDPKIRSRISEAESRQFIDLLNHEGGIVDDPDLSLSVHSSDPDDDYLIALAATTRSVVVSGDHHLLDLAGQLPVHSPAAFLRLLTAER
ncbi:MAG: putative toxin-antitoxin system toxin component, PIN family [Acidobacteria bacterium]|nr:putative toxin-antitoxin system toxin component, PIN family [Acidobacteriota bacterium]